MLWLCHLTHNKYIASKIYKIHSHKFTIDFYEFLKYFILTTLKLRTERKKIQTWWALSFQLPGNLENNEQLHVCAWRKIRIYDIVLWDQAGICLLLACYLWNHWTVHISLQSLVWITRYYWFLDFKECTGAEATVIMFDPSMLNIIIRFTWDGRKKKQTGFQEISSNKL